MRKIVILVLSVAVSLVIFTYLSIPSMFNNGETVWREYTDYDDKTDFDSVTFDLWRKVSKKEVVLDSEVPFLVLFDANVRFEFYGVDQINVDYSWPYGYFWGRTDLMGGILYFNYCIVALEKDLVQSKVCLQSIVNPDEFNKSFDNGFIENNPNGYVERMFTLKVVDELTFTSTHASVTEEEYRMINKRLVTYGYDHIIWMDYEFYPNE